MCRMLLYSFTFHLFILLGGCVGACHDVHVNVRGQLVGISFLLPPGVPGTGLGGSGLAASVYPSVSLASV